jgi:AcrR family transcriptional regulator
MPRRPDLARRSELARAAFDVLQNRGMQTSMRELADALGVKRPTLYFYFPDLGAVFETVLDQMYQGLAAAVMAKVTAAAHPLDRLHAVVTATLEYHRERPQLIHGLLQLWATGGRHVDILDRERRIVIAARDALVADLQAGIARGEVLPCDPDRIVDLVLATCDGVLVHHVLGIARADDVTDELALRVLEPLRPRSKPRKKRTP